MSAAINFAAQQERSSAEPFRRLMLLDELLAYHRFPPMSPWWRDQLYAFYKGGKRRLIVRAGRRGGKSSTLCRVAVAEALYGEHNIPPGDVGVFAIVSVTRSESSERLKTIAAILDAMRVGYEKDATRIRIKDMPVEFRTYAASFRTAVGFTCIGCVFDELARWLDNETGANPATQVLRSIRPSMATMKNAREFMISSPWSTIDAHAEAFAAGDTPQQMVAAATSWEANPTLTEDGCRMLEPDEATFRREYAAEPMSASAASFFDHTAIAAAADEWLKIPRIAGQGESVTAGADFGFRRDSSALAVVHRRADVMILADMLELCPQTTGPLRPSETVRAFADVCKRHNISSLMADGHYQESITEHLADENLGFQIAPRDVPSTYVRFRTLLHGGRIKIPNNKQLLRDLCEVQSAPTPSGRVRMILPRRSGGGHSDLVSAMILACWPKAGKPVGAPVEMPAGWTDEEVEEVARLERELNDERTGSYQTAQAASWLTDQN
tara:strand:+ start:1067 stop:2557 length:1491 start_codon:yes stop_codon:yes gene_type:complete